MHLTEFGEPDAQDVVVCLHGLGGSALNYGLLAPLLAGGRRVVVPDLPGHGRSFVPGRGADVLGTTLQVVADLVASETARRVALIGHSMGAIVAALHAARSPETVERLVLLDPPVPNPTRLHRDLRLTARSAFLHLPGVGALVGHQIAAMSPDRLVARQLADATPHPEQISAEAVAATVAETAAVRGTDGGRAAQQAQFQAILDVVALLARASRWRRTLATITAPTLWLHGEEDPLADVAAARTLAASRPDWRFRTRPDVGHLPHLEAPGWTAEAIEEMTRP